MADGILEKAIICVVMVIVGGVVCAIGFSAQNGWIVDFGIALAFAPPVAIVIMEFL
ncbi:MAG: hypothetical protein WA833_00705 [Nitrosotalea sp.]